MTILGIVSNVAAMTTIGSEVMTIARLQMTDGFTTAPAMTITPGMMMKTVRIVNI
ncbi:MAG: hypothetical protein M3O09_01155 [Acidobacteriota bacterium]|nr:hypothetical protein [Acidobacteriota bacterium]